MEPVDGANAYPRMQPFSRFPPSHRCRFRRAKTDFNPERPMTANETLRRLKEMKKNKKQNMEEPLFDRLARPKSAKSKFKRGPKSRVRVGAA